MKVTERDAFLMRLFKVVQWAQLKPYAYMYDLYTLGTSLLTEYRDLSAKEINRQLNKWESQ